MGLIMDLSDLESFVDDEMTRVKRKEVEIAEQAVAKAKAEGNYHDHTGRLRNSYRYTVDSTGIELENTAPYASKVESEGKNVLISATLWADERLNEEFG